jgi:hypothetical protein
MIMQRLMYRFPSYIIGQLEISITTNPCSSLLMWQVRKSTCFSFKVEIVHFKLWLHQLPTISPQTPAFLTKCGGARIIIMQRLIIVFGGS